MHETQLCFLPATEQARMIRARDISCVELLEAHLAQIERLNPLVNAIVTLTPEMAMARAQAADAQLAAGGAIGALHGLPVAHKDLVLTKGVRTTFGSPIFADFVPDQDELIVERLRRAGAISIGKTNTPEFGAGSQTFNQVFGATRNPYDLTKTCGGSSGGAAVALACGMLPIADGSDMGGSLRNPAGFCNVVGLRPSVGRVPVYPARAAFSQISVAGMMARTVQDLALGLSAVAGPDPRAPLSISEPGVIFSQPLERSFRNVRIAWSPDLGELPVDPQVTAAIEAQRSTFAALGCLIEEATPDLSGADEIFKTIRAWAFELSHGELLDQHHDQMKPTVVWNIEAGRRLSGPQLARAERLRTALFQHMHEFMQRYEFLILPVSQVPPFALETEYITSINGVAMETYIDWMRSCYFITVTGHPAIAVPCGFTPEGLPIGIQIVGRYRDDFGVLQLAHAFEQATGFGKRRPDL